MVRDALHRKVAGYAFQALFLLALLCAVIVAAPREKGFGPMPVVAPPAPMPVTYANPYDAPQQLMVGIYAADKLPEPPADRVIRALIVPHHLTASATIAAGIRMLRHQDVDRILLVSPDHFHKCPTLLCTVDGDFKTAFGEVKAAPETLAALRASPLVTETPDLFKQEHGIYAVLPFIAHERPGLPVTPLAISQDVPWEKQKQALLDVIGNAVDNRTMLIVSSDFSHYLPLGTADAMDEATAETLFAKDLDGIGKLKDPDQSDCPRCLWALASLADARGYYNPSIVMHTNSARILDDLQAASTTSHFAMAWYQDDPIDAHALTVGGDVTLTRDGTPKLSPALAAWWAGDGPRFVNLEGPLGSKCAPRANPFLFCNLESDWLAIKDLATDWGVMNNHMLDLGAKGFQETRRLIEADGETSVGPAPVDDGHLRLLAVTGIMNPVPEAKAADLPGTTAAVLAALKVSKPDELTVVLVHAGTEYQALTSEGEDAYLERFIDAGADAVVVSHSHLVGDLLLYKDKPIFRGIGNFLFDQKDMTVTATSKLARLRKAGGRVRFQTFTAR